MSTKRHAGTGSTPESHAGVPVDAASAAVPVDAVTEVADEALDLVSGGGTRRPWRELRDYWAIRTVRRRLGG